MGDPMALKLGFSGLTDFDVASPQKLRQDLQREHQSVASAFARVERLVEPIPVPRKVVGSGRADFFELIVVDTTSGDVPIELPRITAQDEGKWVEVLKTVTANTVTVRPQDGQKLQGAAFGNLTTPIGVYRFRAAGGNWWTRV